MLISHPFLWNGELMGLAHKILDGVDLRNLSVVAASIIFLENVFIHQIHSRFDSRNMMNTLSHMIFQCMVLSVFVIHCFVSFVSEKFVFITIGILFVFFFCLANN